MKYWFPNFSVLYISCHVAWSSRFFWKPSIFIPVISAPQAHSKKYTPRTIAILSCMLFFLNFYFNFFGLQAKICREMNWQIRFSRYTLHFSSAIDLKQSFWQDRDFNTDSINYILLEAKLCSNWVTTRSLVLENNSFLSTYFNNF